MPVNSINYTNKLNKSEIKKQLIYMLNSLIGSTQGELVLYLSLFSTLVTQMTEFNLITLLGGLVTAIIMSYKVTCMVNGGCSVIPWLNVVGSIALVSVTIYKAYINLHGKDKDLKDHWTNKIFPLR